MATYIKCTIPNSGYIAPISANGPVLKPIQLTQAQIAAVRAIGFIVNVLEPEMVEKPVLEKVIVPEVKVEKVIAKKIVAEEVVTKPVVPEPVVEEVVVPEPVVEEVVVPEPVVEDDEEVVEDDEEVVEDDEEVVEVTASEGEEIVIKTDTELNSLRFSELKAYATYLNQFEGVSIALKATNKQLLNSVKSALSKL